MLKKIILFLGLVLPASSAFSQAKLIEKVNANGKEVLIPYEKYTLPNGLTIVLHEDKSDPICHVDVTYHVGSAREEIGKSGFAHFFEHMMFQGSDNVADEQHFKIITEAGGTLNGTTNIDRTNYFETVPSNQLEKMLWLEADRMGFLLDAVTQQKFEIQRATVKNERGQNYDNRPYGLVQETLSKHLYPYGHPYSWLTIGYVEDLNRVDVNDLKNFFLRWYGPNNAVITVGGDIDKAQTLKWIEKYFGSIPRGPEVEKTVLPMPKVNSTRYVTMTDQYAKLPMLVCAIPTVPNYHKDEAALDCLAEILGGGNTSRLFQALTKKQLALNASASHPTGELSGTFQFSISVKGGTPLKSMYDKLQEIVADFEKNGPTDDDISKFRQSREADMIYALESVSGKVSQLASFQTFTGNANYIKEEMKRYTSVTKEDVIRVYNQYIKGKPMVVLSVLTKGSENVEVQAPNYKAEVDPSYKAPDYGYTKLKYNKAKDNFDRSKMPPTGANPSIKVPKLKKIDITDDVKVIASSSNEIPVVVFTVALKGGRMIEQNDLNKVGVATMFASMMGEDTKKHTAEEISVMLDKLGSSISFSTDIDATNIMVRCLKKNLKPTLDILKELISEPDFKEETFTRIKTQIIENIKNSKARAAVVASTAYSKINYTENHFMGYSSNGTEATMNNITLEDVNNYYNKYFSANGAEIVIVGDLADKDWMEIAGSIGQLKKYKVDLPEFPRLAKMEANPKTIYVVNVPKAAQTEFRIGYITKLKFDATGEYYKAGLMNFPLGGAFNCRINLNLREDKGWTYGARGGFSGNEYTGTYTFSSGIKADKTDSALVEVMKEINNYVATGITNEEMSFMKSAIGQSDARKYETLFQKAGFLSTILSYDLPFNYVDKQNEILKNVTTNELNELAAKYLKENSLNIVLAGDLEKIGPGLKQLGYNIVELDAEGNRKN